MSYGLRIRPAADHDVDDQAAYIVRDSIRQAMRFYDAVLATYKMILEAPRRWPLYGFELPPLCDLRKRSVLGFPKHLVFYRIDADMVEVVRVIHGARDLPCVLASTEL